MDQNNQQPSAPAPSITDYATTPVAVPAPVAPVAPPSVNPYKTLSIVGLVLAFLVALAGLIISIFALYKSTKAGFKNRLALAGIIVAIANTVVSLSIAAVVLVNYQATLLKANVANTCLTSDNDDDGMVTYQGIMYDCATNEPMKMNM